MFNALLRKETKIQKKGGEREMRRLSKTLIILVTVFALTSLCGYQEAMAFDVWRTVKNVIESAYDALGRLIGQSQRVSSEGVDLDGNRYTSTETVEFEIKNGQAFAKTRTIETRSTPLGDDSGTYSYSKEIINYTYDGNGILSGATGTEYIEGKTKEGATYSGTFELEFTLIDGDAVVSKRVGNIVYKNTAGQEKFTRHIETTYKYDIIGGKVVQTDSYTTQVDTFPETYKYTDKDGNQVDTGTHLFQAQYIHTHYEYNSDGSLKSASGEGNGWGLVNTSNGYMVYTSNITVTYEIKNGVARQTKFEEKAYYVPAENAPPQINPVDPLGRIIGMFSIHSDEVRGGQNRGAYNQYTYLVVQTDDGKVYLLRALTYAGQGNPDQTTFNLTGYGIGDKIQFEGTTISGQGDQTANRIWKLTKISKQ